MIPSAGLFLPETLHRRERPKSSQMEGGNTRLRYFQRKPGQPKDEAREAGTSLPSGLDVAPTDTTDIFSSTTTAFHFADYVFTSSKASSESHALAYLIDRVRKDVSEASRLYLSPRISNFLDAWPDKKSWIDTILMDMRRSLNDIGDYMETFRVAGDDGGAAGLKKRFEWIAGHQKRLMNKQQSLSACHQSLVTAISVMQTVELCGVTNKTLQDPIYEAPVQPWVKPDDAHILRGPYSRRMYRMSQKNLSLSSMYLPDPDEDDIETRSVNSIPAELPGSTPDDIFPSNEAISSRSPSLRSTYERKSMRRSYLATAIDDPTMYTPAHTSPTMGSPLPELENLPIQHATDRSLAQNLFDQFLSIPSTTSHNTRKSLDSARPYSHPAQSHNQAHPATRPRTLSDFAGTLPTVAERTVERNDSTTSTTAIITVPQVAKRYHASPVYIRRHAGRHRSMPSVLPHVQSQSSLTEDLAAWMTTVHSDKLESAEWDASSVVSSTSISVASCPVATPAPVYASQVDQTHNEIHQDEAPVASASEQEPDAAPFVQDTEHAPHRAPNIDTINNQDCAAFMHSTSSSIITRKPLPSTATIHTWMQTTTSAPTINKERSKFIDTTIYKPYRSPPTSPPDVFEDTELSLLQQNMLRQTYVPDIEMPVLEKDRIPQAAPIPELPNDDTIARDEVPASAKEILPQAAAEPVVEPPYDDTRAKEEEAQVTKPMSAQAKRRAAHRRRMELDFGEKS